MIGNPPYDVLEKERGAASWPHEALVQYVRERPDYQHAMGGKLNLFRFFLVRSLHLVRIGGRFGMIMPLALMADASCNAPRRFLITNSIGVEADCFPQKDNAARRVFHSAKLSTGIVVCRRAKAHLGETAVLNVRTYPWNLFTDVCREYSVRFHELALIDPENIPIPLCDKSSWHLCKRLHESPSVTRMGDCGWIRITRGEINQTIYRDFIHERPGLARLLKGVEVGQYCQRETLKQGKREWFDERAFLKKNTERPVVRSKRIATQRITGVDERLRIVATVIDPPCYFADSTNSIFIEPISGHRLEYVLGLLNSTLFQWRFKLTSTNNNVGTNELACMPLRIIAFGQKDDVARHERMVSLVSQMLTLHQQLAAAMTPHEKTVLETQITATDRQIDRLVYDLYGLTEDEIKIVEEATA